MRHRKDCGGRDTPSQEFAALPQIRMNPLSSDYYLAALMRRSISCSASDAELPDQRNERAVNNAWRVTWSTRSMMM
jgi:hypothetical protein